MAEKLPYKFRRSSSIVITLVNAILFLGIFNDTININTNIASTGISVGLVMTVINLFLLWLISTHQVP